jgi:hypothetical protein
MEWLKAQINTLWQLFGEHSDPLSVVIDVACLLLAYLTLRCAIYSYRNSKAKSDLPSSQTITQTHHGSGHNVGGNMHVTSEYATGRNDKEA